MIVRRRGDLASGERLAAELAQELRVASRRVIVTRSIDQADGLPRGAATPKACSRSSFPRSRSTSDRQARSWRLRPADLARYDWIVVSSPNGARAILDAMGRACRRNPGRSRPPSARRPPMRLRTAGIELDIRAGKCEQRGTGLRAPVRVRRADPRRPRQPGRQPPRRGVAQSRRGGADDVVALIRTRRGARGRHAIFAGRAAGPPPLLPSLPGASRSPGGRRRSLFIARPAGGKRAWRRVSLVVPPEPDAWGCSAHLASACPTCRNYFLPWRPSETLVSSYAARRPAAETRPRDAPSPPAPDAGAARPGPRDAARSGDARGAALRPAGTRGARADRLDARPGPPVARPGRRGGRAPGRARRRRRDPVRPAGEQGRAGQRRFRR